MALALEVVYGNARAYVYDDYCNSISDDEKKERKRKLREIIGDIASSTGAKETLAANLELLKQNSPSNVDYIWHSNT